MREKNGLKIEFIHFADIKLIFKREGKIEREGSKEKGRKWEEYKIFQVIIFLFETSFSNKLSHSRHT